MAVKLTNAFAGISCPHIGVSPGREVRPLRLARGEVANCGKNFAVSIASRERI
jgi:hypothetical protein